MGDMRKFTAGRGCFAPPLPELKDVNNNDDGLAQTYAPSDAVALHSVARNEPKLGGLTLLTVRPPLVFAILPSPVYY